VKKIFGEDPVASLDLASPRGRKLEAIFGTAPIAALDLALAPPERLDRIESFFGESPAISPDVSPRSGGDGDDVSSSSTSSRRRLVNTASQFLSLRPAKTHTAESSVPCGACGDVRATEGGRGIRCVRDGVRVILCRRCYAKFQAQFDV
jgi:hypothetical protein